MTWIACITYPLLAIAAGVTVLAVQALKPSTDGAFVFFSAWLLLPYAAMAALLFFKRAAAVAAAWHGVATLVSVGGLLFLVDVVYWNRDAQGALAVIMVPLLQGLALAVLLTITAWRVRR